ncbi:regulator of nonsense transcripts 3A-like [Rhinolophus ferrumequinum]|uniref:regulator of nonsense transcripts 3A-like n=1 Tax=Rhinolophus ferrumequinum TaxID=59479 RepID=UPI00140F59CC|nr:regulator of nonsense transcripts 3A-like [Rhinolophus ferrumequinum]
MGRGKRRGGRRGERDRAEEWGGGGGEGLRMVSCWWGQRRASASAPRTAAGQRGRELLVPADTGFSAPSDAVFLVVIRHLPPSLTKEQLEEQLHPLPAHDYFEFFTADLSLYPHLYSRAYINFRNLEDIFLFRDNFDEYIFIDNKVWVIGLEYLELVELAPFQKIAKRKLKKKDAKTGSIEDDVEYKKFLETYCVEEEKTSANPETLLGDIEAKTRELIVSPFLSDSTGCQAGPQGPGYAHP